MKNAPMKSTINRKRVISKQKAQNSIMTSRLRSMMIGASITARITTGSQNLGSENKKKISTGMSMATSMRTMVIHSTAVFKKTKATTTDLRTLMATISKSSTIMKKRMAFMMIIAILIKIKTLLDLSATSSLYPI